MDRLVLFAGLLCMLHAVRAADVGCNLNYNLDAYGSCTQNGCCQFDGHETSPSLCDGSNEVCCYRADLCPRTGSNFCFRTYGTWISRYNYHGSAADVLSGFQALAAIGITRVYFNIWADGYIYARSNTATSNGAEYVRDALQWAVDAAQSTGLEVYAWFEYGTQAHYGTTPTNSFASACDAKGWLLVDYVSGQPVYTSPEGGNYVYCDVTNAAVRNFFADMTADIVRNYPGLDGIQYDDHMSMPHGFTDTDSLPQNTRYQIMEDFMVQIRNAVRAVRLSAQVSYSPSPVTFAQQNHNVNWLNYLLDGVVDEVVPQYYRSTAADYQNTIDDDLYRVQGYQSAMLGGIRLSGSGADTPDAEATSMIQISYVEKMKGVSFWFADDLILGQYNPPPLDYC